MTTKKTQKDITAPEETSPEEVTLNKDGFAPGQIMSFDDIMKAKRKQADRLKSDKE